MYQKSAKGWLKHLDFIIFDQFCLQVAFVVAYCMRHGVTLPYTNIEYRNVAIVFALIEIIVSFFGDAFSGVLRRGYYKEFIAAGKHACLIILLMACYLFAVHEGEMYSRTAMFSTGILYFVFTYLNRIAWKKYVGKKREYNLRSLLLISTSDLMEQTIENLSEGTVKHWHIAGIVFTDGTDDLKEVKGIPVVADLNTVAGYVCREWIDEVFINLPKGVHLQESLINDFTGMGVTVHLKIAETGMIGQKKIVEKMGEYTVLTTSVNIASQKQLFAKRVLDIIGGVIGCALTGVLFLFVAPAIYIKSPGPIFFSQTRVGKNGKKFKIYKFRSMYMDAEERKKELLKENKIKDGMMFKMDDDPRIIGGKKGIGGYIRALSIDEFPQFFNVLKGDMSLVGTRPPTIDEWEKYELHHRVRLSIKPGITGMWQISGRSDITDFEEVVKLDTEYIENWNIGMDIKILLKTVKTVLQSDGAQ